ADAEVDERTGRDVGRDERGEFVAVAQGRGAAHAGPPVVTTWSVWMPGVTTCSGSMAPVSTTRRTWTTVVAAAVAMTGPKLRAVLRETRLPARAAGSALAGATSAVSG